MRFLAFLLMFLPGLAAAQSYPARLAPLINDQAGLITANSENHLRQALTTLRAETGVEALVLTLNSWQVFGGHEDIESFATGLFNHWGIGEAGQNDGILILIARDEGEMRVELGSGYDGGYNWQTGQLIEYDFLPHFREDDFDRGIRDGTLAVIAKIARPFAEGQAAPVIPAGDDALNTAETGRGVGTGVIAGVFVAFIALVTFLKKKFGIGNRTCPTCGQKTLSRSSRTLSYSTGTTRGTREDTIRCSNCDYRDVKKLALPRVRDNDTRNGFRGGGASGGGSGGGGSSSGGGASGKW